MKKPTSLYKFIRITFFSLFFLSSAYAEIECDPSGIQNGVELTEEQRCGVEILSIMTNFLLDDDSTPPPPQKPTTNPELPFETNTTEPLITIKGQAGTTVLVNGVEYGELNASGELETNLINLVEGENNISIVLRDNAGNASEPLTGTVTVDITAPDKPVVRDPDPIPSVVTTNTLDINITGEIGADVYVNGIHEGVIDNNGILKITLGLAVGNNDFNITLKDAVGNESDSKILTSIRFNPSVDAPTVKFIQDINPDDKKITDGELGGSTTIDVKIGLTDNEVGDKLVYRDIYNTVNNVEINASMKSDGYIIKLEPKVLFNHYKICAYVVDDSNNTSVEVCDNTQYIGENGHLNVEIITDANNDGNVTIQERNGTNEVNVTTTFNDLDETKTYDLTLTSTNPSSTVTVELNETTIANGYTETYVVTGNNALFTVSAQLSLSGTNTGEPAEDNASILKGYPGNPEIRITEDTNNDGIITFDELDGTIGVEGTLPPNAQAGDVLIIRNAYNQTREINLTQAHINQGSATFELIPESNNTYIPCAKLRNDVGLETPWVCDRATLAPYSHLWIYSSEYGNVENNGSTFVHLIDTHLGEDDNVTINIDMPDDIELNMILNYSIDNGDMTTIEINQTVIDEGEFTFSIDPALNQVYTVFAKLERPLTHTKQYTGTYKFKVVDEAPTEAPTVEIIEDLDNDGYIESGTELNGTVDVNISLPTGVHIGDILRIIDTSGIETSIDINQSMIDHGYIVKYTPVMGNLYQVTASIIDASGNESASGSDSARLIDTYAGKPTITFPQDADGNGVLSSSELISSITPVQVKIEFADDTSVGDTLFIQDPNQLGYLEQIEITQVMLDTGHIFREYGQVSGNTYVIRAYIEEATPFNVSEITEGKIIVE